MNKIYFDNCATTPLSREAKDAICAAMDLYGNPSSLHTMGVDAEKLVSEARRVILSSLGVRGISKITEKQLIFTASGTEADNLAVMGTAAAKNFAPGKKIIISDSEHPAIMQPVSELERRGFNVVRIPTVGGVPDYEMIEREADKNTVLASFMLVNNETGAIYDIKRISRIIKAANPDAIVHSDCVQAYMNIPFTERSLGADMITLSGHKIGGPKGIGALYVTSEVLKKRQIVPIIFGGGQESGMRSGTENVLGIVGFGAAVRSAAERLSDTAARKAELREYLIRGLSNEARFPGIRLNIPENAAPHVLSVTLPRIRSETMLHCLSLDGIYISSGSACASNTGHASYVLRAFGLSEKDADCTIRISLGSQNTVEEADLFLGVLETALQTIIRL